MFCDASSSDSCPNFLKFDAKIDAGGSVSSSTGCKIETGVVRREPFDLPPGLPATRRSFAVGSFMSQETVRRFGIVCSESEESVRADRKL